jgi:anti-sigma regulatory factor (Ser/Thr protein kinase)
VWAATRGSIVRVGFSPDLTSVREARLLAATHLKDLPKPVLDEALLVISELATNAVVHARTEFVLEIDRAGNQMVLSVFDSSEMLPNVQREANDAHGRGLQIIGTLCENWGVTPSVAGKRVWGILRTDRDD